MPNILIGNEEDNHLFAGNEGAILRGLGGNDVLVGGFGDDTLEGGSGNDILHGSEGNNTYLFGRGDGQDVIQSYDSSIAKFNTIRFGEDIAPDDIVIERDAYSLVLRIRGTTDSIRIESYFLGGGADQSAHPFMIDEIRFFDGASWSRANILAAFRPIAQLDDGDNVYTDGGSADGKGGNDTLYGGWDDDVLRGGAGNDVLHGFDGDDILDGGAGDDMLYGSTGNNTFQFARGWGHDTIVLDYYGSTRASATIIELAHALPGTLALRRSDDVAGNDLIIVSKDGGDSITVRGYFDPNQAVLAASVRITYADHSTWDFQRISQALHSPTDATFIGTGDSDVLSGTYGDDLLDGGAGGDTLFGGIGNDVLLGGDGFDALYGDDGDDILDAGAGDAMLDAGAGNNLIIFGRDAGQYWVHSGPYGTNTIVLDADVRPDEVTVTRLETGELSVAITGTTARIVLPLLPDMQGLPTGPNQTYAQLKFADGTVWDNAILLRMMYTGDENDNRIDGSWGDDALDGRGGSDHLFGHDGNDKLRGGSGNDVLEGERGNDVLLGQDGNDQLIGGEGDDLLNGGAGDDFLVGMSGNNVFQVDLHGGADRIMVWHQPDAANTLQFGEGIAPEDVMARFDSYNGSLLLTIKGGPDNVIVDGYRAAEGQPEGLQAIRFANGVTWNNADIARQALTGDDNRNWIEGGAGNDTLDGRGGDDDLKGHDGDDVLIGGAGNDFMDGGSGADTYVFNRGDGHDVIAEGHAVGTPYLANVMRFGAGITTADVKFELMGGTLRISYGLQDDILVHNFNAYAPAAINRFEFADNTAYSYAQLATNAPQLMHPVADAHVAEGQYLEFGMPGYAFYDRDPGDVLTYRLGAAGGGELPSWLNFDTRTGTLYGTPGYAAAASLSLTITATDSNGLSASDDFMLTVHQANPAPLLRAAIGAKSAVEGSPFSMAIPGATFIDPEGGALTYKLALTTGPLPAWLTFDSASMTLSGTPGHANTGTLKLRLTALESGGQSAYTDYTLNIPNINQAPVLAQAIANQVAAVDSPFSMTIPAGTFADPDGDALTYALALADAAPLPAWLQFDSATMTVSGTPSLADTRPLQLRLTATDAGGKQAVADYTLRMAYDNHAPQLVRVPVNRSVEDGTPFSYVLPADMFSDVDGFDGGVLQVTGLPAWLSFNAQTRTLSGTASRADAGVKALTVTWTDNGGLTASSDLTVTVTAAAGIARNGSAGADILTGKSNNDLLRGLSGDDTLNGGFGADRMEGGAGNDTFYVDHAGDMVVENAGEGTDTVMASISYVLGSNVERVTLQGNAALSATGNTLNNTLTGNSGANVLDGGTGADMLAGGGGNDTYIVDHIGDAVNEGFNAGFDWVQSSVARTLGMYQEALTLTGSAAVNGTGNTSNNLLQGNSGVNTLNGGDGNDILQGGGGDDFLTDTSTKGNLFDGGAGADRLAGGNGNDLFIGGAGNDIIYTGNGADIIAFNRGDGQDSVEGLGSGKTISLGQDIRYSDLALARSGGDLVLKLGMDEQISFKGWFDSASARCVTTLQMVIDGGADYVAGSFSPINDNKVEQFNFTDLVAKFMALPPGPDASLSWSPASLLPQFVKTGPGSDGVAFGGDLAYQYALDGSLAVLSAMPALAILGSASFGGNQLLQGASALNDGFAVLY